MNVSTLNTLLSEGVIDQEGMWPRIVDYESKTVSFTFEFGLPSLPISPGILIIRGPRQYGKSTWLDLNLRETILKFGKATAFYLNGDYLSSMDDLEREILALVPAFRKNSPVKRLFVDEITAVTDWQKCIKRLWDQGVLRDILLVSTGSKAFDLRRGAERLPGRKGNLEKTEYVFLPISYRQFYERCHSTFGEKSWIAYMISGGSPVLCNDLAHAGKLPEASLQIIKDWILGEVVASGRSRVFFHNVLESLFRFATTPVGYAKLARESGLANNSVASGYIDQLSDLLTVIPSFQWDSSRKILLANKPCKFHFVNMTAVIAFSRTAIRLLSDFENLPPETKGVWLEWLVAQEIWRRTILDRNEEEAERLGFWKSEHHEIDFITANQQFIEVKWGRAGPLDFSWFPKSFPKKELQVVCQTPFESQSVRGVTPHTFLLGDP